MTNVLYVTYASINFDGATYSLMDLIRAVRHNVHPIVLLRSRGCVYDYFKENNVECIVCDFEENMVGIPTNLLKYIKYAIKYVPKYLRYNKKNRKCVNYIAEQLKNRNIQIVHTNNTVLSVGYEIAKRMNVKHVWHLRGFMDLAFGWKPFKGWANLKREVADSDAAIGITKAVLEHYISPMNNNAYVIFDAVRSKHDKSLVFPKEKYFLFCAALLSKQKGCDFAIRAFARSGMSSQGYRLRIIGESDAKYGKEIRKLATANGVLNSIDFMGRSNNVKDHMARAAAFLMCSENEGLGRVSVEAMFYGCLVLGRNSGGTKEFVRDKKTGFLFNNIEECVLLMRKVNHPETTCIINNAQHFACSNFAIEDFGWKIMDLYHEILHTL